MKKIILYIIIVILLIAIIGGITYLVIDKNQENNQTKENNSQPQENTNQQKEETLSNTEIQNYLSYVPFLFGNTWLDVQYNDAYSGENNTIDTINKEILMNMAYSNTEDYEFSDNEEMPLIQNKGESMDGYEASRYHQVSDFQNYLTTTYNYTQALLDEFAVPGGSTWKQGDFYLTFLGDGGVPYYKYTVSSNYIIENDNLVITEEAFFIYNCNNNSLCSKDMAVYKNSTDMHNETNMITSFDISDSDKLKSEDINFTKYVNSLDITPTKFKHTFKKGNNGYYWYSTQIVD